MLGGMRADARGVCTVVATGVRGGARGMLGGMLGICARTFICLQPLLIVAFPVGWFAWSLEIRPIVAMYVKPELLDCVGPRRWPGRAAAAHGFWIVRRRTQPARFS